MKYIPGSNYEYSATKGGKIYSHKSERFLKPRTNKHGYAKIFLSKNGLRYQRSVHRLIAITYIENPENKPCINHKDGNKLNNKLANLEWCTHLENNIHAIEVLGNRSRKRVPAYK